MRELILAVDGVEESPERDPFQSQKMLKGLLKRANVMPSARQGQAFLIERHLMEKLVASAELNAGDLVLEVGTGTGGLTGYLLRSAGHVITVEIDNRLRAIARRELGEPEGLTLLGCDVLKSKHELDPTVVGAIREKWESGKFGRFKLVANLPYAVASPLIADLLEFEPLPERMCFTVQYEVAQRLGAKAGGHDYGWLSILVQSLAEIEGITQVPASCFFPRPKVASTILRLIPKRERPSEERLRQLTEVVAQLFQHRRKMILGSLKKLAKERGGEWSAEEVLEETGIDGKMRPEEVEVEKFWQLSDAILGRMGKGR